jgi:hypothetical protein
MTTRLNLLFYPSLRQVETPFNVAPDWHQPTVEFFQNLLDHRLIERKFRARLARP